MVCGPSRTLRCATPCPEELPSRAECLRKTRRLTSRHITAAALPNAQREINRPEEQPAVSEPVEAAVDATLADGESRLTLVYSGDCWTEISDATGRRLLFDMGRSGRTVELTGRAPFSVLLGNVDNVDVSVNGRDYPITTTNPGGRTARLTITNL